MTSSKLAETAFDEAAHWDLNRLYGDLATVKQRNLTSTEKICLNGLLRGTDPAQIAATLHRQPQGLRVDLSRGLYRYIADLTRHPVKNWREVPVILERSGYRLLHQDMIEPVVPENRNIENRNIENWDTRNAVPSSLPSTPVPTSIATPVHNLPVHDFSVMIGRDRELNQLFNLLSYDYPAHCISVEGMGGMGKTTLAISVARRFLQLPEPVFGAYIFASAKQQRLTAHGVVPRLKPERTLHDLFRAIARTFQQPNLLLGDFDEQLERIQDVLSRQRTLLIVDNLETVEDYPLILAFLYDLPPTVKLLLTSRRQTPFESLYLDVLPETEGIQLVHHQAQIKQVSVSLEDARNLHQRTSGIPAAIVYAVGQLTSGYPLKDIPTRLTLKQGDYVRFYFETTVLPLRGSVSHELLMGLALFARSASEVAIAHVANCGERHATLDGLAHLQQLSLVKQDGDRYGMLSLTRELVGTELEAHPEFEQAARERWVSWYLRFAQEHGGKDWKEWNDYRDLDQEWDNLQDVIEWCMAEGRYADVKQFWWAVKSYTHAQGYRGNRLTYWNTRLDWTNWLIQAAEQHQDLPTALDVMLDQGRTLTLLGQEKRFHQADALYTKAWELRHHNDLQFQIELAIQIVVLRIEQQQFSAAMDWLGQAKALLGEPSIDRQQYIQQYIQLLYYEGTIHYKNQYYSQAKRLFQEVLHQAEAVRWQRAIFLAKDWLADIAIQQGNLDEAETVFQEGLQVAQANQDCCRAAFCKRSLAHLEQVRGNQIMAQQWAEEAQQNFEQLGMVLEANETAELLQRLAC